MTERRMNIWIWLQNGRIMKAILCASEGLIKIFDENDQLLLKRSGLTRIQVKQIENNILKYGARRLSKEAEPFKFL